MHRSRDSSGPLLGTSSEGTNRWRTGRYRAGLSHMYTPRPTSFAGSPLLGAPPVRESESACSKFSRLLQEAHSSALQDTPGGKPLAQGSGYQGHKIPSLGPEAPVPKLLRVLATDSFQLDACLGVPLLSTSSQVPRTRAPCWPEGEPEAQPSSPCGLGGRGWL